MFNDPFARQKLNMLLSTVEFKPVENPKPNESPMMPHVVAEGAVEVAGVKFRCYLLSTGARVFDADDLEKYLPKQYKNGHDIKK